MITVILTKYKREKLFNEQYSSIINQTFPVNEILICDNRVQNTGVWSRFSLALHSKNPFVCVIDDDTIPGPRWLENCFKSFNTCEGLYGTCGYIFKSNTHYQDNYVRHGWCNPNNEIMEVDYVVHNWFFKKEWLRHFWSEIPHPKYWLCGEDMNFSYQLQKNGIKTYVPPHPENLSDMWGSIKGWEYGQDECSLWESNPDNFKNNMFEFFQNQINKGWKLKYEVRS